MRDGMTVRIRKDGIERIVVSEVIAWDLINKIHAFLVHFGTDKTLSFAPKYFEIKNLERLTRDAVASCKIYIAMKPYVRPTREIEYYELPDGPKKVVSIDIYGPLPRTVNGNKYI